MVFNNNLLLGAGGQGGEATFDSTLIGNSAWYDGSSDYMNSPSFSAQADPTCFIFATWIQLLDFSIGSLGQYLWSAERPSNYASIRISNTNKLIAYSNPGQFESSMIFRDIGWYHIICSYKGPDDTIRMFVNGNEITVTKSNSNTLASNLEPVHASHTHRIGAYFSGATGGTLATAKSYMAQTVFLDGFSFQDGDVTISDFLDTFTFGTNGSQFIPKKNSDLATLAGTAGANSYVIDYADSSNLGNDISSKNNNFTLVSMDSANQSVHTPSKVYATLNPLVAANAAFDLASGATEAISAVNNGNINASMVLPSTGVYYWEVERNEANDGGGTFSWYAGIMEADGNADAIMFLSAVAYSYYSFNGTFYEEGSAVATGNSWNADGDKVAFEFDADNGTLKYYKNNSLERTKTGLTHSGGYVPFFARTGGSTSSTLTVKFKQSEWAYTPPTSGALELVSTNIPTPSFQGIDYFDATLYEGNGQNQRVGDFVPFTDTYTVDKSAMFDDGDRRYLARTYTASDTARSSNSQATISYWIKFCSNGANQDILTTSNSGQTDRLRHYINDQSGQQSIYMTLDGPSTNRDFEIPISKLSEQEWTNIVYNIDVDNSTAADKIKCWVNGVQQTSTDTSYQSASNADYFLFANEEHFIGNLAPASAGYTVFCFNSYLAEMHVLDGQLKPPTDFGQVDTSTNRWVPKDYKTNVGAYGNRGFYMAFDNATGTGNGVGTDSSGNGFNFTESFVSGGSAWATSDQFTDTPSKNFDNLGGASSGSPTISDGHTLATIAAGGKQIRSNFNLNAGKWYVEVDIQATNNSASVGLVPSRSATFANGPGRDANGGISYETDGDVFSDNVQDATAEASFAAGDVVQMAIDMDAKKVYFGKNNTFGGNPAAGTGGHFLPASIISDGAAIITLGGYSGSQAATMQINYGQFLNFDGGSTTNGFKYTPPTGFKAVNQDNLDDTASKLTALAWIKNRDAADDNIWMDRVIGTSGYLSTTQNDSGTAATSHGDGGTDILTTNANVVQRFLQRGVQIGNDENVNTANESYVLWQWLLGDSATTGSSITTGSPSLSTTGIVSDANHFSIVQYTGNGTDNATFAHGLGSTPNFVMVKRISGSATNSDWTIHISGLGTDNYIYPHYRIALSVGASGNGMTPDANLVEIGTGVAINTSGATHMAYSFKNTPGLCKIGTYTGNSSTDGAYVSTGFKPRFIWIFNTTLTSADAERPIIDTARYKFNGSTTAGGNNGGVVFSDQRKAEEAQNTSLGVNPAIDILSDGFKLRANDSTINTGTTYLYISMAEIAGGGTLPPIYSR